MAGHCPAEGGALRHAQRDERFRESVVIGWKPRPASSGATTLSVPGALAHRTGNDPSGFLDMGVWREGGSDGWQALLASPEELLEIRKQQRGTFTSRAVGDDDFVGRLEQQFQEPLRPHQSVRLSVCNSLNASDLVP